MSSGACVLLWWVQVLLRRRCQVQALGSEADQAREIAEPLKAAEEGVGSKEGEDESWLQVSIKQWKQELKNMERECEAEVQRARRCGSDAKLRRGGWRVGVFQVKMRVSSV